MRPVTLYALSPLNTIYSCCVPSLLAVFALWHAQVHVSSTNYSNKAFYIEILIDNLLAIWSALGIPNIDPNYEHVGFQKDLNDVRFRCKDDIIENMVGLENVFNIIQENTSIHSFTDV